MELQLEAPNKRYEMQKWCQRGRFFKVDFREPVKQLARKKDKMYQEKCNRSVDFLKLREGVYETRV